MTNQARAKAKRLAREFLQRGDATGWFEILYSEAQENEQAIQWAGMVSNPNLVEWLNQQHVQGEGHRALVVGCGLGDDAEELARRGFTVVACDIAPTAIAWCQKRFPDSPVQYVVADVLNAPSDWAESFDFVYEGYTLQVLPPDVRKKAMECIASFLANEGTLLVICRGRTPEDDSGTMPWPLTRQDLEILLDTGLQQIHFEDYMDHEDPPTRRFRVQYRKQG